MLKMSLLVIEKLVSAAVLLSALTVGYLTMRHDVPLGLMVLLGQVHGLITHRHQSVAEEAGHVAVHKRH